MKRVVRILFLINCIISATPLFSSFGQEIEGMVKYSPDFKFKDGIYLNFEQVKFNNPIPKAKLLTSVDYNDREFFKRILEMDKIYFYDNLGVRQEIAKIVYGVIHGMVLYMFRYRKTLTGLLLLATYVILLQT